MTFSARDSIQLTEADQPGHDRFLKHSSGDVGTAGLKKMPLCLQGYVKCSCCEAFPDDPACHGNHTDLSDITSPCTRHLVGALC